MKKRLLISSALMTAVLACALGTGTYAWYEASRAGDTLSKATGVGSAQISTSSQSLSVGATDTKVTLSFTAASVNATLELTNDAGVTYYVDTNGNQHEKTTGNKVGSFTISAGWDGGSAPSADVVDALEGKSVTFTLGATGTIRLLGSNDAADKLEQGETLTVTVKIVDGVPTIENESERVVYFGVNPANENGLEDASGITTVAGGTITAA